MEKSRINHILHSHVNGSFVLTIQYVLRTWVIYDHTYVFDPIPFVVFDTKKTSNI
jgi:hypothetical protein